MGDNGAIGLSHLQLSYSFIRKVQFRPWAPLISLKYISYSLSPIAAVPAAEPLQGWDCMPSLK